MQPEPPRPLSPPASRTPPWRSTDTRTALGLGLAVALAYTLVGALLHPTGSLYGETDAYVARAVSMRTGEGPTADPFHPYGVSLAIWLLSATGLDPFAAGRAVSALAAGVFAAAIFGIARGFVGRGPAAAAAVAVAAGEVGFVHAQLAASEMPSAAPLALGLWCWTRAAAREHGGLRLCAAGGAAFGLAIACRTTAIMALPALLPLLVGVPARRAVRTAVAAAGGFAIGFAPELAARLVWGAPPERTGMLNTLVLKYRHGLDWSTFAWADYAHLSPRESLALLLDDWPRHLGVWFADLGALLAGGLASPFGLDGVLGAAVSLGMAAALVAALVRGPRPRRVLACGALAFGGGLALAFAPIGRYLLPVLPAVVPLAVSAWPGARARAASWTTALVLLLAALTQLPRVAGDFVALHGGPEQQAARALVERERRPLILLCNFAASFELEGALFLVRQEVLQRPDRDGDATWAALLDQASRQLIDFVLLDVARDGALVDRLRRALPAACAIERDDDLFVVRLPRWPGATALRAERLDRPTAAEGNHLRVRAPEGTRVAVASVHVRSPRGTWTTQPAAVEPGADAFAVVLPPPGALPPGVWTLHPWCVTADQRMLRGPPVELDDTGR
ncbi:MAG: glycosyltransferase family 39 protein [Planctomycetota bacterium]